MIETKKLLLKLSKRFPKSIKDRRDPIGLQTGKLPLKVNKILLCLDFDEEVLPIAKKEKPDLILTHHPFIFGTKYQVFKRDSFKKELCDKIDALGIPVYSMHTNFDTGIGGMNDALAEALELNNIRQLEHCKMARGGELKKSMEVHEFAKYAKTKFNVDRGQLVASGKKNIKSVAIVGGGGWYLYDVARLEGYDIFISGDVPHHGRREVISRQYNYLDMPHEIEKIFMPTMKKHLLAIDPSLDVVIVDHEKLPDLI